jgi:hypothetical protein
MPLCIQTCSPPLQPHTKPAAPHPTSSLFTPHPTTHHSQPLAHTPPTHPARPPSSPPPLNPPTLQGQRRVQGVRIHVVPSGAPPQLRISCLVHIHDVIQVRCSSASRVRWAGVLEGVCQNVGGGYTLVSAAARALWRGGRGVDSVCGCCVGACMLVMPLHRPLPWRWRTHTHHQLQPVTPTEHPWNTQKQARKQT